MESDVVGDVAAGKGKDVDLCGVGLPPYLGIPMTPFFTNTHLPIYRGPRPRSHLNRHSCLHMVCSTHHHHHGHVILDRVVCNPDNPRQYKPLSTD